MRKIVKRKRRLFVKKVKNVIGIFFVCSLIFKVTMVDAGINDSSIEKNRVDGVYAVTNFNGVDRIFYLNMYTLNERVSYCIELGVDISSTIYNSTSDFSVSNLDKEQVDYIRNVSYFGYGYDNHKNIEYYMATQEIIWEYLNNIEIEWTNEMSLDGKKINIDSYKTEIFNLVNGYYNNISFSGYEHGMNVSIGEEIVVEDINGVLKNYDVIGGEHSSVDVIDNKLYIKFDSNYVGQEVIFLERKQIYDYDSMLFYQGSSQKLISNGNIEEEIELNFNIKGKDISFQLKDSVDIKHNGQFSYLGICYELFDENYKYYGRFDSDENGSFVIKNMPYGKYRIRGIGVNRAYYFDNVDYNFNFVSEEEIVYLNVHPVVNEIKILKLYGDGDKLREENGVIFDVYNADGTIYSQIITDSYGVGVVSVPYGKYVIKQKTSSYGYAKVEDFFVDSTKRISDGLIYTLVDEVINSNLVINTKDVEGNLIVEDGISYKLKKNDQYLEFDGISQFDSVNGVIVLPDKIDYGDYVIEIVNNSSNYYRGNTNIEFSIGDDSNFIFKDNELWFELDVQYSAKKGKVKVSAYKEKMFYEGNSYYYEYLKNGNLDLELVANEDIVVNDVIVYKIGDIINKIKTNEEGNFLIDDIFLGKYCLIGDMVKSCFEVVDSEIVDIKIEEKLSKGNVNVYNITNDFQKIMGTTMKFFDCDGQLIHIGVTNDEGVIKLKDLPYGEYCFKETNVSDGYLINEDEVCFSVDSENLLELEIVNKRTGKKVIDVPNTFSDKKSINKIVILIVVVLGGILYKVKINGKFS